MDDLWFKNRGLIKVLYQDQQKTLKEVKETLERDYRFPTQSLSTYESKIRDLLGLRKKLKARDWPVVYHVSRLRGYGKFDVDVNGTLIPWPRVWKEIRRSGATRSTPPTNISEQDLPAGVKILPRSNTIPPDSRSQSSVIQSSEPIRETSPHPTEEAMSWMEVALSGRTHNHNYHENYFNQVQNNHNAVISCRQSREPLLSSTVVNLGLETLPWNQCRKMLSSLLAQIPVIEGSRTTGDAVPHVLTSAVSLFGNSNSLSVSKAPNGNHHSASWIHLARAPSTTKVDDSDGYQSLAASIYVLSNGLRKDSQNRTLVKLATTEFQRMPQSSLPVLFKSNALSLRAVWDRYIQSYKYVTDDLVGADENEMDHDPELAALLVSTALDTHPDWINGIEDKILYIGASAINRTIVLYLLDRRVRPSYRDSKHRTAIAVASELGAHSLVKLLIDNCNVNAPDVKHTFRLSHFIVDGDEITKSRKSTPVQKSITNFGQYLIYAFSWFDTRASALCSDGKLPGPNSTVGRLLRTLDSFLEAGAAVDLPFPLEFCGLAEFRREYEQEPEFFLSFLDMAFYTCEPIFARMSPRSSKDTHRYLTRIGVWGAAVEGASSLKRYLSSKTAYSERQLERHLVLVLFELFFLRLQGSCCKVMDKSNLRVARTLIEIGTINGSFLDRSRNHLLLIQCLKIARRDGLAEDLVFIINYFILRMGQRVATSLLENWVQKEGTNIMEIFGPKYFYPVQMFGATGGRALVRAVLCSNSAALHLLLQWGADANAEFIRSVVKCSETRSRKATVLGHIFEQLKYQQGDELFGMCRILIESGAKLRHRLSDDTCYQLLEIATIRCSSEDPSKLLNLVRFMQDYPGEMRRITAGDWARLLRLAGDSARIGDQAYVELFEKFFRDYYTPNSAPVLAPLILSGRSKELIENLVQSGADINESTGGLTDLERGSARHKPPKAPRYTPLQASIRSNRLEMAYWLLELGADVNARLPGYEAYGSALCHACSLYVGSEDDRLQKLQLIKSLIVRGADVNGNFSNNMTNEPWFIRRPLSQCALTGDIEAATLLLQYMADPNVVTFGTFGQKSETALDVAAYCGHLDMVQLFLHAGGLSGEPGLTGYDGASKTAQEQRHGAISELIRRHHSLVEKRCEQDPSLRIRHRVLIDRLDDASRAAKDERFLYLRDEDWLSSSDDDEDY